MKKLVAPIFSIAGGIALGSEMSRITNQKRKKAKEEGKHIPYGFYEAKIKRPIDLILSLFLLIVLSPLMTMIYFFVWIKLGTPVLFVQERPGLNEKIFKIYKFRTMTNKKADNGELLPDNERLTNFGKILRSTSLDELPELVNIVKGDMAFVGPRPLLVEYLPYYNKYQRHRHDVRPGLTGLAQINGRNNLSWNEKFKNDIKYIKKITFFGDLCIFLRTIVIVLKRVGINSRTSITMKSFIEME